MFFKRTSEKESSKWKKSTLNSTVSFIKLRATKNDEYDTIDNQVEEANLVIDNDTCIVYINNSNGITPYIGKNGKYCRYYMGQIIELD